MNLMMCLLLLWSPAQSEDCIQETRALLQTGRFIRALETIDTCMAEGLPRYRRVQAYELRARLRVYVQDFDGARADVAQLLRLDPQFRSNKEISHPVFHSMVMQRQSEIEKDQVRSVSKASEDRRLAPGYVVVIEREDIQQSGYNDLVSLLSDVSGFDISRGSGDVYANLYQRGFRSGANDHMLLLVNGIEQNDLHSGSAYLSRQYPLSNIEQVEIIYGPASTSYGPNAYSGVVNVITTSATSMDDSFASEIYLEGGSEQARTLDLTLHSKRQHALSWSLTTRMFQSDGQDLSSYKDWDYGPLNIKDDTYHDALTYRGPVVEQLLEEAPDIETSPYVHVSIDPQGNPHITPTLEGIARARSLDDAVRNSQDGESIAYSDTAEMWYVHGQVNLDKFSIGFETWKREEGNTGWYTDLARAGADNGNVWVPQQLSYFLNYNTNLNYWNISLSSRYKKHELGDTSQVLLTGYFNRSRGILDLLEGKQARWEKQYYEQISNQLRNEIRVAYSHWEHFRPTFGLETRTSTIQRDYLLTEEEDGQIIIEPTESTSSKNEDYAAFATLVAQPWATGNKPIRHLTFSLGLRLDHNRILDEVDDREEDFEETSPRLAVIYAPDDWFVKGVFTEAYRLPSNFKRFSTIDGFREATPVNLSPEQVTNYEVSTGWERAWDDDKSLRLDAVVYDTTYKGVISLEQIFTDDFIRTFRFSNQAGISVSGLQSSARLKFQAWERPWTVGGNITLTDARADGAFDLFNDKTQVSDIAHHRYNLSVHTRIWRGWDAQLRLNHVGKRRTGKGTTTPRNPQNGLDPYTLLHLTSHYKLPVRWGDLAARLRVDNLLDETYSHPGVWSANGISYASNLPQPGRRVYLGLTFRH